MIFIGVDPGIAHFGIAAYDGNRFAVHGGSLPAVEGTDLRFTKICNSTISFVQLLNTLWDRYQEIHIEIPVKRERGEKKGTGKDLIPVALIAGAIGAIFQTLGGHHVSVHFHQPQAWKGQTPKAIHHSRLDLPPSAKDWTEHEKDAAGLALFGLRLYKAQEEAREAQRKARTP